MVFASTVRFTTNTAFRVGLVHVNDCFTDWWVSSLGVLLVCCVGGFSEGVTPSILSEPGS